MLSAMQIQLSENYASSSSQSDCQSQTLQVKCRNYGTILLKSNNLDLVASLATSQLCALEFWPLSLPKVHVINKNKLQLYLPNQIKWYNTTTRIGCGVGVFLLPQNWQLYPSEAKEC